MILVKEVISARQLRDFIEFPNKLYKGNPYYVPPLYLDEKMNLTKKKNPAYDYCDTKIFLAYKDGKLAGRICGLINRAYNEKWDRKCIRFCRWDVIDDIEVTRALFNEVERYGVENGLEQIMGPIGFCDLDRQGLLVEGFEEMGMFITIYNHPYYPRHLEELGFVKDADWTEMQIFAPKEMNPKIARVAEGVLKKLDLELVHFPKKKMIKPYIKDVFHMINDTYSHLYGVVPLTERQISLYVKQYYPIINIDYLYIVLDKEQKLAGFGLAAPSFAKAMRQCGGHLFPFGWYQMLHTIKKHDVIDLYLISVRPELQSKGINGIILNEAIKVAMRNGVKYAETGPELELNDKVQAQWKNFETRHHKRRRCYLKDINREAE